MSTHYRKQINSLTGIHYRLNQPTQQNGLVSRLNFSNAAIHLQDLGSLTHKISPSHNPTNKFGPQVSDGSTSSENFNPASAIT